MGRSLLRLRPLQDQYCALQFVQGIHTLIFLDEHQDGKLKQQGMEQLLGQLQPVLILGYVLQSQREQ